MRNMTFKKFGIISLVAMMTLTTMMPSVVHAAGNENATKAVDANGYNVLGSATSYSKDGNDVTFNIATGEKIRFSFLEENVFRMYMAPVGEDFREYPAPNSADHTATITNKKDSEYKTEYNVNVTVSDEGTKFVVKTGKVTVEIAKEVTLIKVMKANGETVWEETAPLRYKTGSTIQTLKTDKDEYFYGGGTQNGRFSHKGQEIEIVNTNSWVNGGVASPNPFYWSTDGYGVVRNTWKPGKYDFGKNEANTVTTTHNEKRFDAYYFIDDTAETILADYYELTGKPVELPEYASYLGHLNCYNRDYWLKTTEGNGIKLGDNWYKESQSDNGGEKEALLGDAETTASQIIRDHKEYDMPLGWFLPNDGYGCGYGQEATQAGDIDNLKDFADYAIENGVQTGLWTQSNLWPADPTNPKKDERDIYKEVEAGVHSVKTDVAWVGAGYSMALNGISVAYDAIATKSNMKPNIVTLDGWAGTQRYGGIWSGDQYGGQWEYIRFHIPTYIGTGLSGQPNVGSDMDGIFGGKNEKVWTRDFQWKAFTTYMLDMDGWGSNQKSPWALGENGTSINRAYLKLKAQLMPYINTISHEATAQGGLPMIRAMFLEEENAYTLGSDTQYQYMWGDNFLVAPIYKETAADAEGNDIRNDIYLPGTSDIWVDYFTGEQFRGGAVINDFDAPIWKLPVFVKNGSIIPMYAENNNPEAKTAANADGLDRSQRIIEFFPSGSTSFKAFEDDGKTLGSASITTNLTSNVEGDKATLTAEKAVGNGYVGMVKERSNEFVVNVQKAPTAVKGSVKGSNVTFTKVTSQEAYDNATGNVYFYNEDPSIFVKDFASAGSKYATTTETTTPKLYVKSAEKVDITAYDFKVIIEGFDNTQDLGKNELNESIPVPTGLSAGEVTSSEITMKWNDVPTAVSYDIEVDGTIYRNLSKASYMHIGLNFLTDHTYRVRTVNAEGYSNWSTPVTVKTADDPYRNVPKDMEVSFVGGTVPSAYAGKFENIIDGNNNSEYSSAAGGAWKDKELIIDMKRSYAMDSFEYICRQNMGNGAVLKFGLSYSKDGQNWIEYGDFDNVLANSTIVEGNEDGRLFEHDFTTPFSARYLKFKIKDSKGGFLQAYELRPFKKDGDKGSIVGDTNNSDSIEDNDLTFYENYVGLEEVDSDFEYAAALGDINNDKKIDAFDIAYVATQLNGGISSPAKGVDGKLQIVPSKTNIKAGDTVTLDIYGIGLKNVNAFSVKIPVDATQFEVTNFGGASVSTLFMRNFSKTRTHSDKTIDNYVCFTNVGKQDLINGTKSVATVTFKALADFNWDTLAEEAAVVGQDLSYKDAKVDGTITPTPPVTKNVLKEADIKSVGFSNDIQADILATDLWQQANWKTLLFDGKTDELAEFKWFVTGSDITEVVKLPTDMEFAFNKNEPLKSIKVYNRTSSNGRVTSIKAKAYGGAKADVEYDLGTISTAQDVFEFVLPEEATNINKVVITPLTSEGKATGTQTGDESNRMLSLREIEFVTDSKVDATAITFDGTNADTVNVGGLTGVSATVTPNNVSNPFYTLTSSDPTIAQVIKVPTETAYYYAVQGVKAGKVTLTATAEDNPALTTTMEFTVVAGANVKSLEEQISAFEALYENLYTVESYEAVSDLVKAAKVLIKDDKTTQGQVDKAVVDIAKAIQALKFRGSNTEQEDSANIIAQDTLARFDESSMSAAEKEHAGYTIDGDKTTIWHSNYSSSYKLPQYVTIDLGKEYNLEQVDMLPRQNGKNGHITHYRIEVSTDEGEDKTFVPVVEGFFEHDGSTLVDPGVAKKIKFDATAARYVRFIAVESLGDRPSAYASIAELNFYGKQALANVDEVIKAAEKVVNNEEKYTTSTYDVFAVAYEEFKGVVANADATEDAIKLASAKVLAAIDALDTRASSTILASLAANIAQYEAVKDDYTTVEFAEMQAALDVANELMKKDAADIESVEASNANIAIVKAAVGLNKQESAETLLANLKDVIDSAKAILTDVDGIRPGQVEKLEKEIETGVALVEATSDDRVAIKAAIVNITKAVQELYEIVDKSELTALVDLADALLAEGNYTEASKKAVTDAVAAAKLVIANDNATEKAVENAYNALNTAISKLEEIVDVNKDALAAQISITENIVANIANYIDSTVTGIRELLAQANALYANEDATQAEVDAMTAKLTAANFRARVKADKVALADIIAKASSVDLSGKTVESANNLKNALSNAKRIMDNPNATQEEVNMGVLAVQKALDSLVDKKPAASTPGANGGTNTGDTTNTESLIILMALAGAISIYLKRKESLSK